jgi:hypothetical protein
MNRASRAAGQIVALIEDESDGSLQIPLAANKANERAVGWLDEYLDNDNFTTAQDIKQGILRGDKVPEG